MIRQTLPIIKSVVLGQKFSLLLLIVVSVLLGIVPTLKSELEAGIIDEIQRAISGRSQNAASDLRTVLKTDLTRFGESHSEGKEDLAERLALVLFGRLKLGTALPAYLAIAVLALAIGIIATSIQTKISRDVFAELRGRGFEKGLITDPGRLPSVANVAGHYGMAVQQGAQSVANTYGYLLTAGQHVFALGTTLFIVASKSLVFAGCCLGLVLGQVAISVLQAASVGEEAQRTR